MRCAKCRYKLFNGFTKDAEILEKIAGGLQCSKCGVYKQIWLSQQTAEKYKIQSSKYVHLI